MLLQFILTGDLPSTRPCSRMTEKNGLTGKITCGKKIYIERLVHLLLKKNTGNISRESCRSSKQTSANA